MENGKESKPVKVVATSRYWRRGNRLVKLFGRHKRCYNSQLSLNGRYFKRWGKKIGQRELLLFK